MTTLKIIKILVNESYGGFGLSQEALELYAQRKGPDHCYSYREDPLMIQIVEELGSKRASDDYAQLVVHSVVEGYYGISEYDGKEECFFSSRSHVNIKKIIYDTTLTDAQKVSMIRADYDQMDQALALYKTIETNKL